MLERSSEFTKYIGKILNWIFKHIGPEQYLKDDVIKDSIEDTIKYSDIYLNGHALLRFAIAKTQKLEKDINISSSHVILLDLINETYKRIRGRTTNITKTLDVYLIDEDTDAAVTRSANLCGYAYGVHRYILITDLINLEEIDSITIGSVEIKKINEEYVASLPDKIQNTNPFIPSLIGNLFDKKEPLITKKTFLESNNQFVSAEVILKGYQVKGEKSVAFNNAVIELKLVFSYLLLCKWYLDNIQIDEKYKIKTKDLKRDATFAMYGGYSKSVGQQQYYSLNTNNPVLLKPVDIKPLIIQYSDKSIEINKNIKDILVEKCQLDKFNRLVKGDSENSEIRNKMMRSLEWFLKYYHEEDPTNKAIDLFISIEALLSSGPDYMTSTTDDMAENVAIMFTKEVDERYSAKKDFKKIYQKTRNKIMHHGKRIVDDDSHNIEKLKAYLSWSFMGILTRIDEIKSKAKNNMKEYFEKLKLKA